MKINILFSITDDPKGGGNQFLRALKNQFATRGVYSELADADIVLFNSHQNTAAGFKAKRKYRDKIFVHRIDGPIKLYNNMSDKRDDLVYYMNSHIADATIFQSGYSQKASIEMGCPRQKYETVIHNGCDKDIFYRKGKSDIQGRKVKLIASSFSDNWNKGFKTYQWLDRNLDFTRYEMTFVGRTPCEFQNIKILPPKTTGELADFLRGQDIYITASKNESCSNSLIEAMACGLPVLAHNSGSSPELVSEGGMLFDMPEEIPALLDELSERFSLYSEEVEGKYIDESAKEYFDFFDYLLSEKRKGCIEFRKVGIIETAVTVVCEKLKITNPWIRMDKKRKII